MDYIEGKVSILKDLKDLAMGKYYFGALDTAPTGITPKLFERNVPFDMLKGISLRFTTKVPGREEGQHCVFAYPKEYGLLRQVSCGEELPINLIGQWDYIETEKDGLRYYLYWQTKPTKDVDLMYRFEFAEEGRW